MSKQSYEEAPEEDRHHFMSCSVCHEMIDMRDLDEIFDHEVQGEMHGKGTRPDIQYSRSEKVK